MLCFCAEDEQSQGLLWKLHYQVELSDLHQLLSLQSDLLHVDGDGEDRVGATATIPHVTGNGSTGYQHVLFLTWAFT